MDILQLALEWKEVVKTHWSSLQVPSSDVTYRITQVFTSISNALEERTAALTSSKEIRKYLRNTPATEGRGYYYVSSPNLMDRQTSITRSLKQ